MGTAPCFQAYSTPSVSWLPKVAATTKTAPPRLRLTTLAPWSTTHLMPAITSASSAVDPLKTLATTSWASGATPATPRLLSLMAAAMPATWVPWPKSSWADPVHLRAFPSVLRQLVDSTMWPARSSWVRSTPVSTMPIRTPAPVVLAQAAGAPMATRPHCFPKSGSLLACAGGETPAARASPANTATTRRRLEAIIGAPLILGPAGSA